MPVEELNPQYESKQYEFRQMRDTISGSPAVKRSGSLYLPIPTAMHEAGNLQPPASVSSDSDIDQNSFLNVLDNAPWNHQNAAYSSYLQRARFPDMTALLLSGLTGIAIKKDPEMKLPSNIAYLEDSATVDGKTLIELFYSIINELLAVGRYSLLLEVDPVTSKIFINTYSAESFINWKTKFSDLEKSTEVASLAVFQEGCSQEDSDEFSHESDICQLVLRDSGFIENPDENSDDKFVPIDAYNVQRYEDGKEIGNPIFPTLRGVPSPIIPLVTVNADGIGFDVGSTPLIGVSDIAVSIYQKDADMSNAEFLTCNPMLVTTGVDGELDANGNSVAVKFPIGSSITLNLPEADSKAFYVEPEATSLAHMIVRIKDLKEEAAQYGAAILSVDKKSAEATETVKLRQAGQSSSLRTIVKAAGEAVEQILQYAYMWETNSIKESKEIEFTPNMQLVEASLSSQEITAMLQSFINKGISHESFLINMKEGGVKLSAETVEEEIQNILNSAPLLDV